MPISLRRRVSIDFGSDKGRTKQAFADQVNINNIIAKFGKTGMISHVNGRQPFYGDVSGISSYEDALSIVRKADELFNGMSSSVRERFGNDPVEMIEFLQDPKNLEEARSLGMVAMPPVAPVAPVTPPAGGSTPI